MKGKFTMPPESESDRAFAAARKGFWVEKNPHRYADATSMSAQHTALEVMEVHARNPDQLTMLYLHCHGFPYSEQQRGGHEVAKRPDIASRTIAKLSSYRGDWNWQQLLEKSRYSKLEPLINVLTDKTTRHSKKSK